MSPTLRSPALSFPLRPAVVLLLSALSTIAAAEPAAEPALAAPTEAPTETSSASSSPSTALEPVVVTASRIETPLAEVASSMSVVTADTLEERMPASFVETIDELPNVQVTSEGSPLFARVGIRGSDANQITYLIDGVRQDNGALSGNHPTGIFIAPELIKQVEVRNGGGSALYGNGGIGGTLALTTKSAADFLKPGDSLGATVKSAWATGDLSQTTSAFLYGRTESFDTLLAVTRRNGGDSKLSNDKGREKSDTDIGHTSLLLKSTFTPASTTSLGLSYAYDDFDSFGRIDGDPQTYAYEQHRITADLRYADDGFWEGEARLQWTGADYAMDQTLGNLGGAAQGYDDRYEAWSGTLQNTNRFDFLGGHAVTYGVDFSRTEQRSTTYNPFVTEPVPDGSRPDSHALDAGFFVRDEIVLTDLFTVTPVLRGSYFKREADRGELASLSGRRFTPGVTLSVTPSDALTFWASAATGYRPPILDEVYYSQAAIPGLTDAVVHANPDLRPERSTNLEIGLSGRFAGIASELDRASVRAAIFRDDVKDFVNVRSWDDDTGTTHYRPENVGRVLRTGLEATGTYTLRAWEASLSYGLVRAENRETGRRVAGVTPQSVNARLAHRFEPADLKLWYRFHWEDASDEDRRAKKDVDAFSTHAVGLEWTPHVPNFWDFSAGLAVENLTDTVYRRVDGGYGYARAVRLHVTGRF